MLENFFKLLNKTTLYHIHLIDGNGKYLNHHNEQYGLLGKNSDYSIFDEFPQYAKDILANTEYFGGDFYSYKLENFNNGQDIKIILELKFDEELQKRESTQKNFIYTAIAFAVILFFFALYFARLPDFLELKVQKNRLINKLTNYPNRLALLEDLGKKQFKESIIIIISVNNLSKIRNTYGYQFSNQIIQQFCEYLNNFDKSVVEKIYVNGYNIFSLKYKYTSDNNLSIFLEKLFTSIEEYSFKVQFENTSLEFPLEITLGVSDPHKINNTIDELIEAENALDYALEKSRHLTIFDANFKENIENNKENMRLAKIVKQAIDEKRVVMHFQPIYNNKTKQIEKYEALVRIEHDGKLIYPDTFLSIAKQINKYNKLSVIIVEKTLEYFKDKSFEFSINLSIKDIENQEFQSSFLKALEAYEGSNRLVLEIVEQESIDNYDEFLEFAKKVRVFGCKIAIDDFGTGYSNLSYIIHMSEYIDYLKIDGSLIKHINENNKNKMIITSLQLFCNSADIETIAEFVEDKEILETLKLLGVNYSQGYHIGKPQAQI